MAHSIVAPPPRHPVGRWMRIAVRLGVGAGLLYALLLVALWFGQEKLLLVPQVLPADHRFRVGPDVQEVTVDVPGARLNALHLQVPAPRGVVFFLHGNAGSLDNWFVNVDGYRKAGFDLFMIDYRGYGKSSGSVSSQEQLLADARAAWESIAPRYEGKRRVFYGRSLGSGLAAALAAEVQPELTVLVSPYSSIQALTAHYYPWVPSFVLRYPLRTDQVIGRIERPVLLIHGDRDPLIDISHSRTLLPLARHASLVVVPGAGHNDLQRFDLYRSAYFAAIEGR